MAAGSDGASRYPEFSRAQLATLHINTRRGDVEVVSSGTLLEFPQIDPRSANRATTVFGVGHSDPNDATVSNAIVAVNPESGQQSQYDFPDGYIIVEEPLFVADNDRDVEAGCLVGTFLDYLSAESGVYVLNADAIADGPVAIARMGGALPLGFHGAFVPG